MKNLTKHLLLLTTMCLTVMLLSSVFSEKASAQSCTPNPYGCNTCIASSAPTGYSCLWVKDSKASSPYCTPVINTIANTCQSGYTEWYSTDCLNNLCQAPKSTPTPTPSCGIAGNSCCEGVGSDPPFFDPYYYCTGGLTCKDRRCIAPPTPTPQPTTYYDISGVVFHDKNENGTWELPEVTYQGGGLSVKIYDSDAKKTSYATVDLQGFYSAENTLSKGNFINVSLNTVPNGCSVTTITSGSLLVQDDLKIDIGLSCATSTPTPTPTPTPVLEWMLTGTCAVPTPTLTPITTPGAPTPTLTRTLTPSPTPTPTPTPTLTRVEVSTATPTPSPTLTPTPTPTIPTFKPAPISCTNNPPGCDQDLECAFGRKCDCADECASGYFCNSDNFCEGYESPSSPSSPSTPTRTPTPKPGATATPTLQPGSPACPTQSQGNANPKTDCSIDILDYNIWLGEYIEEVQRKRTSQRKADFNKDNKVDLVDFTFYITGLKEFLKL